MIKEVLDHDKYVIEDLPGATRAQKFYSGICSSDKIKLYLPSAIDTDDDEWQWIKKGKKWVY